MVTGCNQPVAVIGLFFGQSEPRGLASRKLYCMILSSQTLALSLPLATSGLIPDHHGRDLASPNLSILPNRTQHEAMTTIRLVSALCLLAGATSTPCLPLAVVLVTAGLAIGATLPADGV
jgi:hypothetical protein